VSERRPAPHSAGPLLLREVIAEDVAVFFEHYAEPDAIWMAGFVSEDPTDRDAFFARWERIMADPTVTIRTIDRAGTVLGHVLSYEIEGRTEVSYWIGREFWGRGIASRALEDFLTRVNTARPMYARVACDNEGSRRVLEKCGFRVVEEARGFAVARGEEIDELLLELGDADGEREE
jgi:RimJ/RimL family protein N-acetyltransferase